MNRIDKCFQELKQNGRRALIPYITAGDPSLETTLKLMHELANNGADVIELGMPFSDPMADGPVIQLACERALANGTTLRKLLEIVKQFRETNTETPLVLMGYLNPIEHFGYAEFAEAAKAVGIDGILAVDMPPEEADIFQPLLEAQDLKSIYLLAPTSTDKRMQEVAKQGSGYVYYVSLKGVTGSGGLDLADVERNMARMRQYIDIPVCVGFGISDGASAKAIGQYADGVIVGSAYIKGIDAAKDETAQLSFAKQLTVELATSLTEIA